MKNNSISKKNFQYLDFTKLRIVNKLLNENKTKMIDDWVESPRVVNILLSIELSSNDFKTVYATNIFNFFLSFTTDQYSYKPCPSAKKFLNRNRENENIIEIIILLCTELKNNFNSTIFLSDINSELKVEITSIYNAILDSNLSYLITKYSDFLLKKHGIDAIKLKMIEESSLLTKTDIYGKISFVSDSYCNLTGYSKEELIGNTFHLVRHPDVPSKLYKSIWEQLKNGKSWEGRLKNYNKNKEEIYYYTKIMPDFDFEDNIIGYTAVKTDLTDKVKARRDSLTGIMNRLSFNEVLTKSVEAYYKNNTKIHLAMIDIDYFKEVNDIHGHGIGDEVLKYFTSIVNKNIRIDDIFARWGGEEFILLFEDISFDIALQSVERVRKALEEATFPKIGKKTASFGLATFSDECKSATDLIEKADMCLYHSKHNGRNTISYSTSCSKTPIILPKTPNSNN